MKKKLTAILAALGITASVIGVDQACLLDEVTLQASTKKICFSTQEQYEEFRTGVIKLYREKTVYPYTQDWHILMAVVNEEAVGKTINAKGSGEEVIDQILQGL